MEQLIFIVLAFLAVAYVFDMWRQSAVKNREEQSPKADVKLQTQNSPLTANEAMPTQTGRFRAKQALESVERKHREESENENASSDANDSEEDALPDPFSNS